MSTPLRWLRALLVFGALTAVFTWPLVTRLRVMDAGDSAFFAWEMAWERHAILHDPAALPHAPIFHPLRFTLGMDEPILGTTVLLVPFWPFTADAVWLYGVARLLTFVLSAFTAYLLARDLGATEPVSLLAGAAFALSPIRTDQIAHLSTLGTQWLPLVVLFMLRYFRTGRLRDSLLAALFFVLQGYACGYHGVIALVVLPLAALPLLWRRWRLLLRAAPAIAVAAAGLLPLYALHRAGLEPLGYQRGTYETSVYSAALESFLATTSGNLVWGELTTPFRTTQANNLFPGLVLPALAIAGGWLCWRRRTWPSREALALGALGLTAALLALGPEVHLMGRTLMPGPFALARELPVFRMIRVPSRAGAFIALAVAMLAARALSRLSPRPAALALLAVAALLETWIAPIPMPAWAKVVDSRRPAPPVYGWMAQQPPGTVFVELPMLDIEGIFEGPPHHESVYMVRQTGHWQPLLNGYAGIEPAPYVAVRERARRFPSVESLDAFVQAGARYVVVHRAGFGPNKWARIERDLPGFATRLVEAVRFEDGDVVYELRLTPPDAPATVSGKESP
ncbi:MAG TPA: hypothetical protein VFQ51_09195 [Vicinamibacteria bacterium]|nr:hypothetical protein [Vicinamibacteria bacterium]